MKMNTSSIHAAITKSLWRHSASISRQLDNSLGAIHGIGLTEYMVLLNLSQAPVKSLRRIDLADALQRTASGITRLLMPMEKIGLVSKEVGHRDARVSLVKISPAGERILADATVTLDHKSENLLKPLNPKQASTLLELLTLMGG
jgi:DNA-binding MarR family transcriptional regulator